MKQSLGLPKTSGLALTISCVDVMVKAASTALVGLEKTNGLGWTVTKIAGDVVSVQMAVPTGVSFVDQRGGLMTHKVIPRPEDGTLSHSIALELKPTPEPIPAVPHGEIFVVYDVLEVPRGAELISCNLCLNPACPRQKDEPRTPCLRSGRRSEA